MPELITERLVLRPPEAADFEGWARLMADPEAARFIGGAQHRAAAWRGFLTMVGSWQIQGFGMFSVLERRSGEWLGRVGPWQPLDWPGSEVGWALLGASQGQGFAHEAAVACIDWAFDALGWSEVIHCIDPVNLPSQRLAERLGACNRGRGCLPPPFEAAHVDLWGQTREQWRRQRRT
jgi:RimJ/RimL family protein N-acetyltransferase